MQPSSDIETPDGAGEVSCRQACWILLAIFLLSCLGRGLLLRYIEAPFIQSDEALYLNLARSLAAGQGARWDGHGTLFPSWLYPGLLSLVIDRGGWVASYGAMRLINVALTSLVPVGVFLLAREATTRRRALQAAGLAALLPGLSYSTAILTENAYYPTGLFALWLIFRAIHQPTLLRNVIAGVACGVAFHAKPNGIILAPIAGLTALIFEAIQLRGDGPAGWPARLGEYGRRVLRYAPMALAWLAVMSLRALELHFIEREPVNLQTMFGFYLFMTHGKFTPQLIEQWQSFGGYLLGWCALAGFVLPFALAGGLGGAERSRLGLLRLLAWVVSLAMLIMAARHPLLNDGDWRFYERYLFPSLPVLIALFFAAGARAREGVPAGVMRGVWVLLIGAAAVYIAQRTLWTTNNDAPTMTFMAMVEKPDAFLNIVKIAYGVLVLGAAGLLIGGRSSVQRGLGIALWFIAGNLAWHATHVAFYAGFYRTQDQTVAQIARITEPGDAVYLMLDGLTDRLVWSIDGCFPGFNVYQNPALTKWNATAWPAFEERLRIHPTPAGGKRFLLALPGTMPQLDSVQRIEEVELYRLP